MSDIQHNACYLATDPTKEVSASAGPNLRSTHAAGQDDNSYTQTPEIIIPFVFASKNPVTGLTVQHVLTVFLCLAGAEPHTLVWGGAPIVKMFISI